MYETKLLNPINGTTNKMINSRSLTNSINDNLDNNNSVNIKKLDLSVEEFFRNKNVFVTGATGFLGTVLVEALLSASPDIGKIYILIREKYGHTPEVRTERLLSKAIFAKHSKETLAKVIPIVGELSEPNFNLNDETMSELQQNVNIIYHSAAAINLNPQARLAIKNNVTGTLRTIELAKSLDNLVAYIYLSTAFCNCNNQGLIKEQIYPTYYNPRALIEMAEDDSTYFPDKDDPNFKSFLKGHSSAYTLTKQLAENLIAKEMVGYPAGIVRPSIIYGTYRYPIEGWCGNANSGHLGFLGGYMKGVLRSFCGNPNAVWDAIPCDYVISASVTMAWYIGTHEIIEPEIIHCTSGQLNPLTYANLCDNMNQNVSKHPSTKILWKPYAKVRNTWRFTTCFYLFHLLPALVLWLPEKIFKISVKRHTLLEHMKLFGRATKVIAFFFTLNCNFDLKNAMRMISTMQEKDRLRYNFDPTTYDWSVLFERNFKGLRYYYFRESKETTFKHTVIWFIYEVLHYGAFGLFFFVMTTVAAQILPLAIALSIAFVTTLLLIWI